MLSSVLGDMLEAKTNIDGPGSVDTGSHHKGYKAGYEDGTECAAGSKDEAVAKGDFNPQPGDADHAPSFKKGYSRGFGHGMDDCQGN